MPCRETKGVEVRIQSVSRMLLTVIAVAAAFGASCAHSSIQPSTAAAPGISQITPTASPVGTAVTITGSGFAPRGNTVKFGTGYIRNIDSADGTTLQFTIPDGLDLCAPDAKGPCPGAYPRVTPGDYAVAVITDGETSNSITFTVTQ
jgi:IPT/TIG domain-containing protein